MKALSITCTLLNSNLISVSPLASRAYKYFRWTPKEAVSPCAATVLPYRYSFLSNAGTILSGTTRSLRECCLVTDSY